MIFRENRLPADDSHEISYFFHYFFLKISKILNCRLLQITRGVFFYVRRMVNLMNSAKVNAYIMHIFGKIEL